MLFLSVSLCLSAFVVNCFFTIRPVKKNLSWIVAFLCQFIILTSIAFGSSTVQKFPVKEVNGSGPLPYNYRVINQKIHAGGHPLRPTLLFYGNSDAQALKILECLKSKGVSTVINLDGNPLIRKRYQKLLEKAGLKEIFVPMSSSKVPTAKEWGEIRSAMEKGDVYIHCKWGADRTGSIMAKYLVEAKGYSPKQAWEAVVSGGLHAGPLGGLKKSRSYCKIVQFFWPGVLEDQEGAKYYR